MGKMLINTFLFVLYVANGKVLADDWWEYGHFYQIYPRSFKDSDGDGIGDLNGITERLPHLKFIGVTGVWLSPVFLSPMKDFGYDISDFRAIQPEYGTMEDFERMTKRFKELDIKLVLDFVPNHASDQHEWFQKAINPNDPDHEKYRDYFIWNKGKLLQNGTRVAPNNWLSIFRGSAWTWVDNLQAFYYHQFLAEQPDLNFRNEVVTEEMNEVLRFWLRKGVDGFRIDAVPHLVETEADAEGNIGDEPKSGICRDDPLSSCYLDHIHTKDLDETFELVYQWRRVIDEPEFANRSKILMTEAYSTLANTMRYYGKVYNGEIVEEGAQIPFNFQLMDANAGTSAGEFKKLISGFLDNLPKGNDVQANWVLENHDRKRIASRYKLTQVDLFNILLKTLPGVTITYYGEEIGMVDVYISWEDTVDPQACQTNPEIFDNHSRDKVRTPLQWDGTKNAGFSTAEKTWLPLADSYKEKNIELQKWQDVSHLQVFLKLIELRQNPTLKYGGIEFKSSILYKNFLIYKRQIEDENASESDVVVVVLNFGKRKRTVYLNKLFGGALPNQLQVAAVSIQSTTLLTGDLVDTKKIVVQPDVGVVFIGK